MPAALGQQYPQVGALTTSPYGTASLVPGEHSHTMHRVSLMSVTCQSVSFGLGFVLVPILTSALALNVNLALWVWLRVSVHLSILCVLRLRQGLE